MERRAFLSADTVPYGAKGVRRGRPVRRLVVLAHVFALLPTSNRAAKPKEQPEGCPSSARRWPWTVIQSRSHNGTAGHLSGCDRAARCPTWKPGRWRE